MTKEELIDLYNKLKDYRSKQFIKRDGSGSRIFSIMLDIEEELYFKYNYEIEDDLWVVSQRIMEA